MMDDDERFDMFGERRDQDSSAAQVILVSALLAIIFVLAYVLSGGTS